MRRKIACVLTAVMTVAFMVLRVVDYTHPSVMIGTFALPDCVIAVALILLVVITLLCYSKSKSIDCTISATSTLGWLATFCGAMLVMSVVLDSFCWTFYNQIPPPNDHILNNVDYYSLIFSLVFGITSGIFLILQGFNWMANIRHNQAYLNWMALAPILWMWFRLARYEISYASTIDITHSFFDFAALVTSSIFFLELAKMIAKIGTAPRNGLIICALLTSACSLSGAPLTFYKLAHGETIHVLLISIVDASIGLFALVIAFQQAFSKQSVDQNNFQNEDLAWTDPAKEREPLDPPFSIDEKLPVVDTTEKTNVNEDDFTASLEDALSNSYISETTSEDSTLSVDDILAELNKNNTI